MQPCLSDPSCYYLLLRFVVHQFHFPALNPATHSPYYLLWWATRSARSMSYGFWHWHMQRIPGGPNVLPSQTFTFTSVIFMFPDAAWTISIKSLWGQLGGIFNLPGDCSYNCKSKFTHFSRQYGYSNGTAILDRYLGDMVPKSQDPKAGQISETEVSPLSGERVVFYLLSPSSIVFQSQPVVISLLIKYLLI